MPCGVIPLPIVARGQFNCPWLMLLPLMVLLGWCYCHIDNIVWLVLLPEWLMLLPHNCSSCLAGIVAIVVDVKSTHGCIGRCYSQGGIWNSPWDNVLILILMFCVGPHPICEADGTCLYSCLGMGHWPLWIEPLWLLLLGSGPLLPTIVKLLMLMLWPVVLQWSNIGEGAFWCSLKLSAKFLADSPMYSSLHPCSLHLYLYMTPLLFVIRSLSLGAMRRLLMVFPPLK